MIDYNNTWKETVKEIIRPTMKSAGFKNEGQNFYKEMDGFYLQMSYQVVSLLDEKKYTFNIGVVHPKVYNIVHGHEGDVVKPLHKNCMNLNFRIEDLINEHKGWYYISKDTDKIEIKQLIRKHLTEYLIPYFEQFTDEKSILKILKENRFINIKQYAVLQILSGDKSGVEKLKESYNKGKELKNERWIKMIEKIADRLDFELEY